MAIIPSSGGRRQLVLDLNGGDAALFKFDDGAPFVGFVPPARPRLGIQMQSRNPDLSLTQLTPGARYLRQSAPAFSNPTWTTLLGLLLTNSSYDYVDETLSNGGFYRAVGVSP